MIQTLINWIQKFFRKEEKNIINIKKEIYIQPEKYEDHFQTINQ